MKRSYKISLEKKTYMLKLRVLSGISVTTKEYNDITG